MSANKNELTCHLLPHLFFVRSSVSENGTMSLGLCLLRIIISVLKLRYIKRFKIMPLRSIPVYDQWTEDTVNSTGAENLFKLTYVKIKLTTFFGLCSQHSQAYIWNCKQFFRLAISLHFTRQQLFDLQTILFYFNFPSQSLPWYQSLSQ